MLQKEGWCLSIFSPGEKHNLPEEQNHFPPVCEHSFLERDKSLSFCCRFTVPRFCSVTKCLVRMCYSSAWLTGIQNTVQELQTSLSLAPQVNQRKQTLQNGTEHSTAAHSRASAGSLQGLHTGIPDFGRNSALSAMASASFLSLCQGGMGKCWKLKEN